MERMRSSSPCQMMLLDVTGCWATHSTWLFQRIIIDESNIDWSRYFINWGCQMLLDVVIRPDRLNAMNTKTNNLSIFVEKKKRAAGCCWMLLHWSQLVSPWNTQTDRNQIKNGWMDAAGYSQAMIQYVPQFHQTTTLLSISKLYATKCY